MGVEGAIALDDDLVTCDVEVNEATVNAAETVATHIDEEGAVVLAVEDGDGSYSSTVSVAYLVAPRISPTATSSTMAPRTAPMKPAVCPAR